MKRLLSNLNVELSAIKGLIGCVAGLSTIGMVSAADAQILQSASYNGHTYHLIDRTETWQGSEDIAIALGGNLVTINDATENAWVLSTFGQTALDDLQNDLGAVKGIPSLWLGLIRDRGTMDWYWTSGEPLLFTNWAPGEPNNSFNEVTSGMLIGNRGLAGWEPGMWHDILDPPVPSWDWGYGVAEITQPIPELETWAMMSFGLVSVAWIVRRRKNVLTTG